MSANHIRRRFLGFVVLAPLSGLIACGYRLRGMVDLPYKAIAITGNPSPPLRADLQTAILTGTDVRVAINPKDADLILDISNELNGREILAYSSTGQISAYRLTIRVTFRAYDLAGTEIIPDNEIYITRDLDFSNTTVLAADQQQAQFLTQMRKDLAVQILRRISAAAKSPRARSF
jgi:LPS-assembly lipoprotein